MAKKRFHEGKNLWQGVPKVNLDENDNQNQNNNQNDNETQQLSLLIAVHGSGYRRLHLFPADRDEHLGHRLGFGIVEIVKAEEGPEDGVVGGQEFQSVGKDCLKL